MKIVKSLLSIFRSPPLSDLEAAILRSMKEETSAWFTTELPGGLVSCRCPARQTVIDLTAKSANSGSIWFSPAFAKAAWEVIHPVHSARLNEKRSQEQASQTARLRSVFKV